jgi:hypothetical protein
MMLLLKDEGLAQDLLNAQRIGKAFSCSSSRRSEIPRRPRGLVAQDASLCNGSAGARDLSDR